MNARSSEPLWPLMGLLHKCHPWHGIDLGKEFPEVVTSYIEMVPTDTVKYEIDKITGHLMIDRPQTYSNVLPCLYGFLPRTLCAERVAELSAQATGRQNLKGDDDMIDKGEADDKIIAVLKGDATYGKWRDISDVSPAIIARLKHYFLTYKRGPDEPNAVCEIDGVYGREVAHEAIRRSHEDYLSRFDSIESLLTAALRG
jgi:inorganic pyrophosphatase